MPPLLTFLCLHPLPLSPLIVSTLSSERSKRCHSWNLPPQGPPSPIPSSWRAFSSYTSPLKVQWSGRQSAVCCCGVPYRQNYVTIVAFQEQTGRLMCTRKSFPATSPASAFSLRFITIPQCASLSFGQLYLLSVFPLTKSPRPFLETSCSSLPEDRWISHASPSIFFLASST